VGWVACSISGGARRVGEVCAASSKGAAAERGAAIIKIILKKGEEPEAWATPPDQGLMIRDG
jgi:hypothetical protein